MDCLLDRLLRCRPHCLLAELLAGSLAGLIAGLFGNLLVGAYAGLLVGWKIAF